MNADGSKDYSGFYDFTQINAKINDYYGTAGEEEKPATGAKIPAAAAFAALAVVFIFRRKEHAR